MKTKRPFKISSVALIVVLLIGIGIRIGYINFIGFRDTIISQQQSHLLTIVKSISRSLDLFIKEKVNNLSGLAKQISLINENQEGGQQNLKKLDQALLENFYNQYSNEIENVRLIDNKGKIIYQYPDNNSKNEKIVSDVDIDHIIKTNKPYIGKTYKLRRNEFAIDILQPIFRDTEFIYILSHTINLNTMYKNLIDPVRAGEKGYAMAKNREGIILMHPVLNQIGIESIKVRKEKFPQYDWSELEELNEKQKREKEGTAVYHSIWWQEEKLKWVRKLSAFTTVDIGQDSWILAVQMAYSEIEQPIKANLINVMTIATIIIIGFIIMTFKIMDIEKNKKALEIETKYLKQLSTASEELRKSEARFRHSEKLKTIGTLTGGIAHEFNNLLTPILGYSEIILRNMPHQNEIYDDVLEINKASKRAKDIIEQILIFSRNDDLSLLLKPVKIDSLIRESTKLIETILPTNIKINKKIDSDSGYILGNQTQIYQVILNLCTNAYQSMKKKGGVLEVILEHIEISDKIAKDLHMQEGSYARIIVKDTGCGMNKNTLDRIFDPFFTTKQVGEGTGLGLSVVHGIIIKHQGSIFVESEVGLGTTVYVYLPIMKDDLVNVKELTKKNLKYEGKILLVDDDMSVLKVIKKGLEQFGYDVVTQIDSLQALEFFHNNSEEFNIIIVDYTMPKISGIELIQKLKEIKKDVKIILISGFIEENNILSRYKAIIEDYIQKPIVVDELVKKINNLNSI